jgi:hypothetical protein
MYTMLFISLCVPACGGAPPPAMAQEAIASHLDNGNQTRVRLADFRKTDGQAAEMFGVKVYQMDFVAFAEFTDDAYYTTGGTLLQSDININTQPISQVPASCEQDLSACFNQRPLRANKGDRLPLAGTAAFERHESGWRITSLTMKLTGGQGQ